MLKAMEAASARAGTRPRLVAEGRSNEQDHRQRGEPDRRHRRVGRGRLPLLRRARTGHRAGRQLDG